jgi:hypothetical protein
MTLADLEVENPEEITAIEQQPTTDAFGND